MWVFIDGMEGVRCVDKADTAPVRSWCWLHVERIPVTEEQWTVYVKVVVVQSSKTITTAFPYGQSPMTHIDSKMSCSHQQSHACSSVTYWTGTTNWCLRF
jgi:hypothetical protein